MLDLLTGPEFLIIAVAAAVTAMIYIFGVLSTLAMLFHEAWKFVAAWALLDIGCPVVHVLNRSPARAEKACPSRKSRLPWVKLSAMPASASARNWTPTAATSGSSSSSPR